MVEHSMIPPEWIKRAKELYSNGLSFKQIASVVNVAPATVQRWFKLLNVNVRQSGGRCTFDSDQAVEMWRRGQTVDQIAATMRVNRTAVYEQLKRKGVDTSARWHADKERLASLVQDGLPDKVVAKQLGCSVATVERYRRDVMSTLTPRFVKARDLRTEIKAALEDSTVGFDQLRTMFPDAPYDSLLRAFNRFRPGEWVSKIKNGPVDPHDVPKIIAALERGDAVAAVARDYATTPKHIRTLIAEHSIKYIPRTHRINDADYDKLSDPAWCKATLAQHSTNGAKWIAEELFGGRLSSDTVREYFRQHGLDPTPPLMSQLVPELTDKEWMESQYKIMTITEIADLLGVSHPVVRDAMSVMGITPTRLQHTSKVEQQVLGFIKSTYNGPVIENDRTIISPHELDIVLPELKVAIEVCGMYWHSEKFKDRFYHQRKMESANKAGYRLITLYEEEITDTDLAPITWRKLSHILGVTSTQPVNARGCTIVELSSADAEGFLKHNHIQGYMKASVRYGLKHGAELVAVVTFKSYAGGVYELSRFATSTRVRGGFTKLLHHFKKNNVWTSIYTFADLRWSSRTNNVYVLAGFTEEHVTQPAYRYYCGRTKKSYHRMHFQRKHLPQRLRKFDPSLTERQNVNIDGYLAIYDCGNVKYKMTNPINPS